MTTFFAFLHHLFAFTLVACIAVEFTLIRQPLTLDTARRLLRTDAALGLSALALFVVGFVRVFYFEKGADYYLTSHAFLTKLGIFVGVAIVSITPTAEFLSWRKALRAGEVPQVEERTLRKIAAFLHFELAAVVVILLCAALMARGG
jgi:putative membrane protein